MLNHVLKIFDTFCRINTLKLFDRRLIVTEPGTGITREQVRDAYGQLAVAAGLDNRTSLPATDTGQSCCAPAQEIPHNTSSSDGSCCTSTEDTCCAPAGNISCCTPTKTSSCCDSDATTMEGFGSALYPAGEQGAIPAEALAASFGCGNPTAVAELREGETVLDLGSGGGIDVLLSARRVGKTGFAYGVDMTDEMLELAEQNRAKAGATNVEFLKGTIEDIPLPGSSVDIVISNCVINLSIDKNTVMTEMFRVLNPGGRIGITDIVAEDRLNPTERAERGSFVGCIAGALSKSEYLEGLKQAGFTDAEVLFTHEVAEGIHGAIIRATKTGENA
ncbi:methyltransferase domain-containing protein [Flaviflexus ciconiae]|uniref:Arsenite methyltransferase n=2 Tax=Flaviflexus ciconiae TaxID=2496867 RepID=A0A3S9Q0C4_9ACTO|nr:methyltransferase domain-containing protein [Flaviflexus ciconiae]